jgi:tRNA1Val (adenine37-N6)-methyltransferase
MEYTVEKLSGGTAVCISKIHRFGTDAFLLSDFRRVKYAEKAMDIGSGCGIIPLRWADVGHKGKCVAVEIDREGTRLLQLSIEKNGLKNIIPVCIDIKNYTEERNFDVISCNPPYFTSGRMKNDRLKATFRHQLTLTDQDVTRAASKLLKDGGRLCMCQRPENLRQVIYAMKSENIEPKVIRFVRRRAESEKPWLVLIDGRKNGGVGLKVMRDLIIYNDDDTPGAEILKIYGKTEAKSEK